MMIITVECPECQTTFPVDPRKVPDGGVKVRCSICSGIFFVDKPEIPAPVATPPVPVPSGGGAEPEDEAAARSAAPAHAAPAEPEEATPPPEDDRDNVDPWSDTGWDDPAEMGAPHPDAADPWSGGMGLPDESVEAEPDDWVVEQSAPVEFEEPSAPVERLETVEEQVRSAAEAHDAGIGEDDDLGEWDEDAVPPAAEAPVGVGEEHDASEAAHAMAEAAEEAVGTMEDEVVDQVVETVEDEVVDQVVETVEDEVADEAPTEARPAGFQFGKRDPHEKARRLARVLVSDMITYNPERHQRALEQGTLHADFEEEIRKSWAEYTDQVGRELAESTSYWFDALNEILARGEKVF